MSDAGSRDTGSPDAGSREVGRVVAQARAQARGLGHRRTGTEHLLLGMLVDEHAGTTDLLAAAGCTLMATQQMVAELVPVRADDAAGDGDESGHGEFTPRAERAIGRAGRFARGERAAEVGARHLLLGVLDVEGLACQVLRRLGVDLAALRRNAERPPVATPASVPAATAAPITAASAPADVPTAASPSIASPTCPGCGIALAGSLAVTVVDAADGSPAGRRVRIAHCTACGVAIGTVT